MNQAFQPRRSARPWRQHVLAKPFGENLLPAMGRNADETADRSAQAHSPLACPVLARCRLTAVVGTNPSISGPGTDRRLLATTKAIADKCAGEVA